MEFERSFIPFGAEISPSTIPPTTIEEAEIFPLTRALLPIITFPEASILPSISPSTRTKPLIFILPETNESEPIIVLIEIY